MKKQFIRPFLLAGAVLFTAQAALFAQDKDKSKDAEQIIITRKGNKNEKTVIELKDGDVLINGKSVKNLADGDITVRYKKLKDIDALIEPGMGNPGNFNFNFDFDDKGGGMSLFKEDSTRAMLGVITDEDERGAVVKSVNEESAAEKAGLKVGDVITKIDNEKIEKPEDIVANVRKHKPGDKINITVLREGKEQKLTAELGKWKGIRMNIQNFRMERPVMPPMPDMPGVEQMPFMYRDRLFGDNAPKLGISIQDSEDGKGVKVLDVDEESNAAKAGIKTDDVITRVNDKEVKSVDDVTREFRQSRDKASVTFQVLRKGKTQNIEVKVPRKLKTAEL